MYNPYISVNNDFQSNHKPIDVMVFYLNFGANWYCFDEEDPLNIYE